MENKNEQKIKGNYDDFVKNYYNAPCKGCPEGHASFWKTVIESDEWKLWQKEQSKNPTRDMPECEELGIISADHWKEFVQFIKKNQLNSLHILGMRDMIANIFIDIRVDGIEITLNKYANYLPDNPHCKYYLENKHH